MSVFVLAGNAQSTSLTLQDAASQVARVVGAQDDPVSVGAYDAIRQVMRRFMAEEWDYLSLRGDDIAVVDHTGLVAGQEGFNGIYSVPSNLSDPISLRLKTNSTDEGGTPLVYVHRIDWDKMVDSNTGAGTRYYSLFQIGQEQKLELLDAPTAAGYLELRYWRKIAVPVDSEDFLDLPEGVMVTAVIELAKAIVATDHGDTRKARAHREDGERDLGKARLKDRRHLAADHGFIPEWAAKFQEPKAKRFEGWGVMNDAAL